MGSEGRGFCNARAMFDFNSMPPLPMGKGMYVQFVLSVCSSQFSKIATSCSIHHVPMYKLFQVLVLLSQVATKFSSRARMYLPTTFLNLHTKSSQAQRNPQDSPMNDIIPSIPIPSLRTSQGPTPRFILPARGEAEKKKKGEGSSC